MGVYLREARSANVVELVIWSGTSTKAYKKTLRRGVRKHTDATPGYSRIL